MDNYFCIICGKDLSGIPWKKKFCSVLCKDIYYTIKRRKGVRGHITIRTTKAARECAFKDMPVGSCELFYKEKRIREVLAISNVINYGLIENLHYKIAKL